MLLYVIYSNKKNFIWGTWWSFFFLSLEHLFVLLLYECVCVVLRFFVLM